MRHSSSLVTSLSHSLIGLDLVLLHFQVGFAFSSDPIGVKFCKHLAFDLVCLDYLCHDDLAKTHLLVSHWFLSKATARIGKAPFARPCLFRPCPISPFPEVLTDHYVCVYQPDHPWCTLPADRDLPSSQLEATSRTRRPRFHQVSFRIDFSWSHHIAPIFFLSSSLSS